MRRGRKPPRGCPAWRSHSGENPDLVLRQEAPDCIVPGKIMGADALADALADAQAFHPNGFIVGAVFNEPRVVELVPESALDVRAEPHICRVRGPVVLEFRRRYSVHTDKTNGVRTLHYYDLNLSLA